MPEQTKKVEPPRGWRRLMWRAPIWLYSLRLGWIVQKRLMLLHHTGRTSGQPRRAVIEIVDHDAAAGTYTAASGFGRMSDWYQNVSAQPDVAIEVGSRRMRARAVALSPEDSGHAMVAYAKRQPKAARELMKFIGYRVDGTDDDYYALGRDFIPFVVFRTE